jgi:hypothetical protein
MPRRPSLCAHSNPLSAKPARQIAGIRMRGERCGKSEKQVPNRGILQPVSPVFLPDSHYFRQSTD